jgi:hypothetical protein
VDGIVKGEKIFGRRKLGKRVGDFDGALLWRRRDFGGMRC